jgi:LPXTG-motif cell wall-anchored protein
MSNVNGSLVCEADGTGTVTAHVEGTEVAVHAVASLNGLGAVELGHGNHSYTLSANFPQGTKVFLNVYRENQDKDNVLIRVLTVDCPPTPNETTTTTTTVTGQTTTTVAQRETQPTLPATGFTGDALLVAGAFGLAGLALMVGSRWPRRRGV